MRLHQRYGLFGRITLIAHQLSLLFISPEQDEETGSLTPTFSWNESSDADLYDEIWYYKSYTFFPAMTMIYLRSV